MTLEKEIFSIFKAGPTKLVLLSKPEFAFLYYFSKRINLLNGKEESYSFQELNSYLEKITLKQKNKKRVLHFFYEWGVAQKNQTVLDDQPLLLDIQYSSKEKVSLDQILSAGSIQLTFHKALSEKKYQQKFNLIQKNLLAGNCYQVNLTHQFSYHYKTQNLFSFFKIWSQLDKRGAFAHATNLPILNKLIISNSPECLWKIKKNKVFAFPIKGTVKIENNDHLKAKSLLLASEKDRGELNMITDLVRNDLAQMSQDVSYVLKDREILDVPGMIHTFSKVMTMMPKNLNLLSLMRILFPGGSITGAPKKRVMEIIKELEDGPRGIYCGSTVLLDGSIQSSSINIRTAVINTQEKIFYYGAGGGITLLSKEHDEYQEILSKISSFVQLIQ
jgi:anthranilate/para-aminobenzoate synthase component I